MFIPVVIIPIVLLIFTLVSIPDFTLLFLPNRLSYLSALAQPISKFHLVLSFLLTTSLFLVDFFASIYFIQRDNFPVDEAADLFDETSHVRHNRIDDEGALVARGVFNALSKAKPRWARIEKNSE